MSELTRCQGWQPPSGLFIPQISNLSSYQSPAGSSTTVTINGFNFTSYSSISFGTFYPTVYFVNSNILRFYVPSTINSGTYPVQVSNGDFQSNIVTYTVDNASGFWINQSGGVITNTNLGGVLVSSLSFTEPVIINSNTYTLGLTDTLIINTHMSSDLILDTTRTTTRKLIFIKNLTSQSVLSNTNNIVSTATTPTNIIAAPYSTTTMYGNNNVFYTLN
jgi:hypothetical protein